MRALVTGADGFLGANLCKALLAAGHEVTGAALSRKGHTALDALGVDVRLEYGDVLDAAYLRRLVNAYEPQWVFHLAAVSIVRIAQADPRRAIETNVMGTLNLLDACRCGNVEAVIVASSDKAYGDYQGAPYEEAWPLKPTGAYELSKALEDTLARGWAHFATTRICVTRCANLYGPGDVNWSRMVPNSCRRIAKGESPEVHPAAWQYQREWLHVEDAARAYLLLAEQGATGEAYNVGSGHVATAGQVARMLARLGGVQAPVESPWQGIVEIPSQRVCWARLASLGWTPQWELHLGLAETLAWYRRYQGGAA